MQLKRRHKYILTALIIYWPAVFIATHIPKVPSWVCRAGMSDKTLHFMAYLILVSLAWLVTSPYKKVNFKAAKVWFVLAVIVWYGAIDEYLQGFVNRTPDVYDFIADLAGTLTGLIILAFLSFWPAVLMISAIVIFAMSNLTKFDLIMSSVSINAGFYFLVYSFFTLTCIQYLQRKKIIKRYSFNEFILAPWVSFALLALVKCTAKIMGREIYLIDILTAAAGIILSAAVSLLTCTTANRRSNPHNQ